MTTLSIWLLIGILVYLALYIKKRRVEPENTKAYEKLPLLARIIGAVVFIILWPVALLELLSGGSSDGE
jgi:ABC-type methionine transport system permease subunit